MPARGRPWWRSSTWRTIPPPRACSPGSPPRVPAAPAAAPRWGGLAARAGDLAAAARADAELAARPRTVGVLLWRARLAAARGDRRAAATLVREAVARGYAYDGMTHAGPELGPLFP